MSAVLYDFAGRGSGSSEDKGEETKGICKGYGC